MKKKFLLIICTIMTSFAFAADPAPMDISSLLEYNPALSLDLEIDGEPGIKGCVGDFNNDGVDDFIITGLYISDSSTNPVTQKGFLRIYLGQKTGTPSLVLDNLDFPIAGNGAIDCQRLADGSYLVALQGGAGGNWTKEKAFEAQIFNLKIEGTNVDFESITTYAGAGRGSLLFLDMNGDGHADIFQGGWDKVDIWTNMANTYINDGTDEWFELETNSGIRPAANNRFVKGDIDGDGKIDLATAIQGAGIFVYFNKGDGTFDELLVAPFAKEERTDGKNMLAEDDASQVALIDFNNDKKPDLVFVGTNNGTGGDWEFVMELYKNNGNKTFSLIEQKNKAGNATTFIGGQRADFAVADFDMDGNMDLIIGAENQNDTKTWECRTYYMNGNGQGGFDQFDITYNEAAENGIVAMSRRANFGQFLVGDFDGNKTPDLITVGTNYYARHPGLRIYYNTSTPSVSGLEVQNATPVYIYCNQNTLYVNNAPNSFISVYSLTGLKVYQDIIKEEQESITLNVTPGIYMVNVKNYTQKIIIR